MLPLQSYRHTHTPTPVVGLFHFLISSLPRWFKHGKAGRLTLRILILTKTCHRTVNPAQNTVDSHHLQGVKCSQKSRQIPHHRSYGKYRVRFLWAFGHIFINPPLCNLVVSVCFTTYLTYIVDSLASSFRPTAPQPMPEWSLPNSGIFSARHPKAFLDGISALHLGAI